MSIDQGFPNTTLYENFKPTVIKVYEKGDFFEFFAGKIDNSNTLAIYRLRLTLKDGAVYNHNMERFAAGALRMAVDCTQNTLDCQIPNQQAVISATLFCDRYVKLRYDLGDRDALQMKEKTEFCPSHRDIKIVRNQEQ